MFRSALVGSVLVFALGNWAFAWNYKEGIDPLTDKPFGYASEYSENGGPLPIWMGVKCWRDGDAQLMFWFPTIEYKVSKSKEPSVLVRVDSGPPFPLIVSISQFGPSYGLVGHSGKNPFVYGLLSDLADAKSRIVAVINNQSFTFSTAGIEQSMISMASRCANGEAK